MSFTVYRSSAGSGKTYTLVKEYIRLLITGPANFRHILAITFTNKAANEMKDRVLETLAGLAEGGNCPSKVIRETLLPALSAETGLDAAEIAGNAKTALEMILHNYADFSIGTIDSFSHKIIRTFAHDFGLPVAFNVELDSDELLSAAVDLLLSKTGEDRELTDLLVNFLFFRMEDDKGWNIDTLLARFARLLFDEESKDRIETLKPVTLERFREIADQVNRQIREFEATIRGIAREAATLVSSHGLSAEDFYYGKSGIGRYFEKLASGDLEDPQPNTRVWQTVEEDKWTSGKISPASRQAIEEIKPLLSGLFERITAELEANFGIYVIRKLLAKTIYPLAVLNEIGKLLDEFKKQNDLVHISEFNARIAEIVMNEPVPFIYERLGERYHHIMIDEFQDTSALQWLNFVPLVENALAGGYFNLVVGDGKQAIYRWRNGDVEQFNNLPELAGSEGNHILHQRQSALVRHYQVHTLGSNYRSNQAVVEFNNRFFRMVSEKVLQGAMGKVYEGLDQMPNPSKPGGYIGIEFIGSDEEAGYRDNTFDRILELIHDAQVRGYAFREMAILCRKNSDASQVARHLMLNGIGVVSADSLLLQSSPNVRFLISCMRYLDNPRHDIVNAEIRKFTGLHEHPGDPLEILSGGNYRSLPVYELCEALAVDFLPPEPDTYTRFFLDEVLSFSMKHSPNAGAFLDWWEKNREKKSIIVPEELDAVRIMSIHKAKGLEFPLVILPFAHEKLENTRDHLWVTLDEEIASGLQTAILTSERALETTVYADLFMQEHEKSMLDMLNLLYVAMTRPEEELHILTRVPPKNWEKMNSLPAFFRYFLQESGMWEEEKRQYQFGEMGQHTTQKRQSRKETILSGYLPGRNWREKIAIRRKAPARWDLEEPGRWSGWGNRIHTILSLIKTRDDIPNAVSKALLEGLIDHTESEEISVMLSGITGDPRLERLFSRDVQVRNEAEILLPDGSFVRPDRIVFDGDAVTILDYKSGKPHPAHSGQLGQYASCLEEMGYRDVRKILVYLGKDTQIVEVSRSE